MKAISDRMAQAIVRRSGREEEYIEVISYALQGILGSAAEFLCLLAAGMALGILKEVLVVSAVFAAMRLAAGGVHFSTFPRCFVSSVLVLTAGGYAAHLLTRSVEAFGVVYLVSGGVFVVYCLYRHSPRDNPNRPIGKGEILGFRRMSFLFAAAAFIYLAAAYYIKGAPLWYHYSVVTGLALEGLSLTDGAYKLIHYIEGIEKRGGVKDEKS